MKLAAIRMKLNDGMTTDWDEVEEDDEEDQEGEEGVSNKRKAQEIS